MMNLRRKNVSGQYEVTQIFNIKHVGLQINTERPQNPFATTN